MEEDAILVLFDLRCPFEEGEDEGGGLCGGEWVCASVWVRRAWWRT
jgi:hypothetical protein